jgi:hypothetical protein
MPNIKEPVIILIPDDHPGWNYEPDPRLRLHTGVHQKR